MPNFPVSPCVLHSPTRGCLGIFPSHTPKRAKFSRPWWTSHYGGKLVGSRTRLGAWLPPACSNLQAGCSFSLFTLSFFDCFYELIIPLLLLCATHPFHPHSFEAPGTHTPAPAGLPLTHPSLSREMAHKEFMECPQETLPWSRPHSSFNTGRKIKKKKSNWRRVWRGEGSRLCQSYTLSPARSGDQASVRLPSPHPPQPAGKRCP